MDDVRPSLIEHWVVEGDRIDPNLLNSVAVTRGLLRKVIKELGLTPVGSRAKFFGPGVTVVYLLGESHMSLHTWPEHGYFYADIATCSVSVSREQIGAAFSTHFNTKFLRIGRKT